MIITRPVKPTEKDLLIGLEGSLLLITSLDDEVIKKIDAPAGGWSHDALEAIDYDAIDPNGWNAYLTEVSSDNWIGSSEV